MTRYNISLNTTSEKTVPRQSLFLGYHNPLGPYLNCCEIWWDTCAESRDVSETSALAWLSSPASERTLSNKDRVLWKAQRSLTWDRALPPRLIMATSLPPREKGLHSKSWTLINFASQSTNKTNQCGIPHFRCLVSATQEAELTWTCSGTHTNNISWGLGTALTCQFDHSVLLLSQPEGLAES